MVVLVAYRTARGSTRGIAQRIAARLTRHGMDVDVRPMDEVAGLGGYDAVVLGSAVHGQRWLPDAARFVTENAASLTGRPVWLFSVSTVGDDESMYPPAVANRFRAMRGESAELRGFRSAVRPEGHRNFAGVVRPGDWSAFGRAFFRASRGRYGDARNWPAIDAWADAIAAKLAARARTS